MSSWDEFNRQKLQEGHYQDTPQSVSNKSSLGFGQWFEEKWKNTPELPYPEIIKKINEKNKLPNH